MTKEYTDRKTFLIAKPELYNNQYMKKECPLREFTLEYYSWFPLSFAGHYTLDKRIFIEID